MSRIEITTERFASMGKVAQVEWCMDIDPKTGISIWWKIFDLEEMLEWSLSGNGCATFCADRGMGIKYEIEKQRGSNNRVVSVRTVGFAASRRSRKMLKVPTEVRKWITSGLPCAMCGTKAGIEVDHKDGNKSILEDPSLKDFQPLCKHCNTRKREVCKKCKKTGERFDAKELGYGMSWTVGTKKFQLQTPRCKGCYWYSPLEFRKEM